MYATKNKLKSTYVWLQLKMHNHVIGVGKKELEMRIVLRQRIGWLQLFVVYANRSIMGAERRKFYNQTNKQLSFKNIFNSKHLHVIRRKKSQLPTRATLLVDSIHLGFCVQSLYERKKEQSKQKHEKKTKKIISHI